VREREREREREKGGYRMNISDLLRYLSSLNYISA
jgi:hypothetical protein